MQLRQWKDEIEKAIDVGYEIAKEVVVNNKVIKLTKNGDIRISSMKSKKSIVFFDNYRKENNDNEVEEV